MRNKSVALPFVLLGLFLILWVNFPKGAVDRLRSGSVAIFSPIWHARDKSPEAKIALEVQRLHVVNQQLRSKLETALEWLAWERGQKEESPLFEVKNLAIPAKVIYRDPTSWSSSLWVKAGEEDNRKLQQKIVAKNSPVVCGMHLVGVVDYVGKSQSRVRLITDSGVVPAVRAVRGAAQNREVALLCAALLQRLEHREDLTGECQGLFDKLNKVQDDQYLAKGELHGSSAPYWRSRSLELKGEGFNYEFPDAHGQKRDLRDPLLLKEGDLLVTSGLDGVFPEGLSVAYVTEVFPLKEGAYAYSLSARPTLSHLSEVQTVFILPPMSEE